MIFMVFVKVCGLTNYDDAEAALQAGADALGFIFFQGSPRAIRADSANVWIRKLSDPAMKVGVFVNAKIEEIVRTVELCGLGAIQLHGDETPHFVSGLKKMIQVRIIRAVRLKPGESVPHSVTAGANFLLIDRYKAGTYGGTGETADWEVAKQLTLLPVPLILSGGLSPENVREACEKVRPYGVDASSSLEKAPGVKDHARVKEFIANAKVDKVENKNQNQ